MDNMKKLIAAAFLALAAAEAEAAPLTFNPVDYGAKLNGTSDDTAAWRAAVNAASQAGGRVEVPCGTSLLTGTVDAQVPIVGQGECSLVAWKGAGAAFRNSAGRGWLVRDLNVMCLRPGQTGYQASDPQGSGGHRLENLRATGCFRGIALINSTTSIIRGASIRSGRENGSSGIFVQNVVNGEGGDNTIEGSSLITTPPAAPNSVAIRHYSSGGLRIINNKILGWTYGYLLQAGDGMHSDVLITGNSIESIVRFGIALNKRVPIQIRNIQILGNQFNNAGGCVANLGAGKWLDDVIIMGNRCPGGVPKLPGVARQIVSGNQ